jgi:hypothetical protein
LYFGGAYKEIFVHADGKTKELETSLRSVYAIAKLAGNIIAIAGADNMIDIFNQNIRLMTLFG